MLTMFTATFNANSQDLVISNKLLSAQQLIDEKLKIIQTSYPYKGPSLPMAETRITLLAVNSQTSKIQQVNELNYIVMLSDHEIINDSIKCKTTKSRGNWISGILKSLILI